MIKSLIISLLLAISIELSISLFVGIRNKNDIISIILVNMITNPIVVFISNILYNYGKLMLFWMVLIVLEIVVAILEGKIFEKILVFKKVSGVKLSLINNVISFICGLLI